MGAGERAGGGLGGRGRGPRTRGAEVPGKASMWRRGPPGFESKGLESHEKGFRGFEVGRRWRR